jgi:Arc/MetJ family transcription regulator
MATNLNINDELLNEAQRLGGKKTKRETVEEALQEYVRRRRQRQILELAGKVDFTDYDYKKERSRGNR